MLRSLIVAVGGVALVSGLIALAAGVVSVGLSLSCTGALVLIGTLFERVIYKRIDPSRPGAGWQRTSERFIDDATGKPVTVYIEPTTGERQYVQE